MQKGILVYNEIRERFDIRFSAEEYYGGLHCGQCFDVKINNKWFPTRIEMADDWYLVGLKKMLGRDVDIAGLEARI